MYYSNYDVWYGLKRRIVRTHDGLPAMSYVHVNLHKSQAKTIILDLGFHQGSTKMYQVAKPWFQYVLTYIRLQNV